MRRVMVRLVKGAYWDAEIKRAQELGLPVLTEAEFLAMLGHTDLITKAKATLK